MDFVVGYGANADRLLARAGLSGTMLDGTSNRIALARFCDLFELAATATGRADLGLEFGHSYRPQHLGFIGYLAVSAATLGNALEHFVRYLPLHQQGTAMAVAPHGRDRVAFSYDIIDESVSARRQDAELSLAIMLNLVREALGRTWLPNEVYFAHSAPMSGTRQHDRIFGAPLHFGQPTNQLILPREVLSVRMPRHDPILFDLILQEFGKFEPSGVGRSDILSAARHHIKRLLPEGRCDLEHVARACGVAPWTLKRRLQDVGYTFQKLLAETRYTLAIEYLTDQGMSITDTALAIGYSEVSAFSRAFRQWTGGNARDFLTRTPSSTVS